MVVALLDLMMFSLDLDFVFVEGDMMGIVLLGLQIDLNYIEEQSLREYSCKFQIIGL